MARLLKITSRTRKVRPYPLHPIQDCLEIATAIFSNNSGLPIDRNILASQLNSTPSSSGFITKLNSSFKYGLTNGGYKDPEISLTSLGQAVVSPKSENEFRLSLIQAALKPDLFRRFYEILDVIKELHDKKRHDYGANEDIFANFRLSELSGISAWQGSVVRMGDKYARISNFIKKGEFKFKEEGIKDTLMDMAIYS